MKQKILQMQKVSLANIHHYTLEKFRRKYTTLKAEWRKISDRCKNGSSLAPEKEPSWYEILNPIFSEKN